MEHPLDRLDWNTVRVIVAVAEAGSITAAARVTGLSVNSMRRAIERLEQQYGVQVFHRETRGARLTDEGRRIIASARDVQTAITALTRSIGQVKKEPATIRVAVSEGLGTFWLLPRLAEFVERHDTVDRIEVQAAIKNVDVLRLEADLSVQLTKPQDPALVIRKLGSLHLVPFASPDYLERYGRPKSLADLASHRVVEQATEQVAGLSEWLGLMFSPAIANQMVRLRTNFSSANYWAIAKSAGLGLLPSYAPFIGARIEYVDLGHSFSVPIWLALHPAVAKSARHRSVIELLVAAFDGRRYPWFKDEFISPDRLRATSPPEMENYFTGFVASLDRRVG